MKWRIREDEFGIETDSFGSQFSSLHPVVRDILLLRGVKMEDVEKFLAPNYETEVLSPFLISGMDRVVERIKKARDNKEKVIVFGDYDADGITATAVMKEILDELGMDSGIYIPDKESEGYGLNNRVLKMFKENSVSLIITVDCGISNFDEVNYANELGMDVIVTDHHNIPSRIPNAFAIINPKLKDSNYPHDNLAGVGVAFKLAQALYEKLLPQKKEQSKWLLDLVALGTIADCVPLLGENRILVKFGLIVLSKTRRIGFQELFRTGRILIDENNIPDTTKIAFQVAPRINAASRMSHAKLAYDLVASKDRVEARSTALELEDQNKSRQKATEYVVQEVEKIINKEYENRKAIFAADEHFPIGIAGLVAGRIASKYSRPTAILAKGETTSKGSLRSIGSLNIVSVLEECSDLLEKFGGHSQAAGVSVKNENLEAFREKFLSVIEKKLNDDDLVATTWIDKCISASDVSFKLIEDLERIKPFGACNEEPVFLLKNLIIHELKWLGNGEKHLKLFLRENNSSPKIFEAIGFSLNEKFGNLKNGDTIDLVCNISKDQWNGNQKIQLRIVDLRRI